MTVIRLHRYSTFTYLDRRKKGNGEIHGASPYCPDRLRRGDSRVDESGSIGSRCLTQPSVRRIVDPHMTRPTKRLRKTCQRYSENIHREETLHTASAFQNVGHNASGIETLEVKSQVLK